MDEPDRQIDVSGKDKEQADLSKRDEPSKKQVISKEDEPSEKQAVSNGDKSSKKQVTVSKGDKISKKQILSRRDKSTEELTPSEMESGKRLLSELSVIYSISSLSSFHREEELLHATVNMATLLLGVRYFGLVALCGDGYHVIASSGFKDPSLLIKKIEEGKPNQFIFSFNCEKPMILFMERNSPITDRERRVYTIFANGLQTALSNAFTLKEKEKAERKLKASLNEKELLLKEIHHRVKNNMQIISSMLSLQSNYVEGEAVNVLKESQNRVKSMAIIHEKLYQSHDLTHINFKEYIESLLNYLFYSYNGNSEAVTIKLDVEDIFLGIETAVPLGLIINELVSNSLKYAFPHGEGEITLKLHRRPEGFELQISDNGIGMPEKIDFTTTKSLGLQLVS
ncbi:MAG: sensor histidine kinase, partial [Methanobacterium paludis]|nr:sensor histidine kinase [Methanobacterium paludis]